MKVDIVLNKTVTPKYATEGSAGFDLASIEDATIRPGDRAIIETGIYCKIPEGYELQIRSRSGLAAKHGIMVLNSPGTIDSDYTGQIKAILYNSGRDEFRIQKGDRIAQGVLSKVYQAEFNIVDVLSETVRGSGGLGSTGIN